MNIRRSITRTAIARAMNPVILAAALITTDFIDALAEIESGMNDAAYNANEQAVGRYQIRPVYLADANAFLGTTYTILEMQDPEKAERVVRGYLTRYAQLFNERHGKMPSPSQLARIHNGGPTGWAKDCTKVYGEKFRAAFGRDTWDQE